MSVSSCSYVVARFVNDPLRQEAKNFGVILQCVERGYVGVKFAANLKERLAPFADDLDVDVVKGYIADLEGMVAGFDGRSRVLPPAPAPLGPTFLTEDLHGAFDGKVQFSVARGTVSDDPAVELEALFQTFVADPNVAHDQLQEPNRLRRELNHELRGAHLLARNKVRPNYTVSLRQKKIPFDFGYRLPKKDVEVLIETVDLTSSSLLERINILSPTAVKFEMMKAEKGSAVRTYSAVKTSANGHSASVHRLELAALKRHTNNVFIVSRPTERAEMIEMIAKHLKVPLQQSVLGEK
jgi:hypothetical protein